MEEQNVAHELFNSTAQNKFLFKQNKNFNKNLQKPN